jgi:O-antigen/teichoic acid export membrane protein
LHAIQLGSRGAPWALALADQLMVGGANFVTILLLGRLAGADNLGVFALAMTVYYLMLAVQESLITMPYTIFGARLKGARHLQYSGAALCQSAAWAACVGATLTIVALSLSLIRGDADLARVVAAFALVSPLWLLREFGRRYLFAHMQVMRVVAMSVAGSMTQLISLSLFAYTGRLSATTALCAMSLGSGVAVFGWLWLSRRAFRFDHARSSYFLLKNWVLGRWILASQATAVLTANVMPWLIVFWLGPRATGIFAACDSILRFANPIIISLRNVLTPKAAIGFSNGGKPAVRRIVWKASALLSLFLFAFCVLLAIAGDPILKRAFGDAYAAYWPVLAVLGLNQLLAGFALAPGQTLLLLERANIILWAEVAGFTTSLVAATVLIPRYGVLGAAFSLLAGNVPFTTWIVSAYLAAMSDNKGGSQLSIGRARPSPAAAGGVSE